jgi:hypothetical protein
MSRHRPTPLLAALAGAALACGCATQQARYDAYDKSLAHWQGASEQSLRDLWGAPKTEEKVEGGKVLVYLTENMSGEQTHPSFSFGVGSFGGWGGGTHTSIGAGVGLTAPVEPSGYASGDSCTTRFLVHDGKVQSWTFEGGGCGVPVL